MKRGKAFPTGWTLKKLGDLGVFLKGKGILKEELSATGLPCIRYGEIYTTHDLRIKRFQSFINRKVAMDSERIYHNDILFAGSGETLEEIGKAVAYTGNEEAYAGGDVIILRIEKGAHAEYLSYALNTDIANRQKRRLGQGHSVVHIYGRDLAELRLPLPSEPEQRKIALILSTWDRAIEKTEQLIAQKQQLKKGLMQQLLTGKVRFREFKNQHIKSAVLGDVVSFSGGSQPPRSNFKFEDAPGYVRLVQNRDYKSDRFKTYIPEDSVSKRCDKTDIMIGRYGPPLFQIFRGLEGAYNVALIKAVPDEKQLLKEYCWYFLNRPELQKYIEGFSQRSGGQTGIEMDRLNSYPLNIPSILEQKRIIEVLSSIDLQIIKMLRELEILKAQKKGLMQQLLTGKVRVKH